MPGKVTMRKSVVPDCKGLTGVQMTELIAIINNNNKWLLSVSTCKHCSTYSINTFNCMISPRDKCPHYPHCTGKAEKVGDPPGWPWLKWDCPLGPHSHSWRLDLVWFHPLTCGGSREEGLQSASCSGFIHKVSGPDFSNWLGTSSQWASKLSHAWAL